MAKIGKGHRLMNLNVSSFLIISAITNSSGMRPNFTYFLPICQLVLFRIRNIIVNENGFTLEDFGVGMDSTTQEKM